MSFVLSASLAARHRPRRFADVVGQRHVKVPLQKALATDRLPRQLLFVGGSGLGKTTLARIVAAALLCENRAPGESEACGTCESCLSITSPQGNHPDVTEFDAASHGYKDDMVELAQKALLAPLRGNYRIFIIDEAHGLSNAGGQAFLKLLEEPPPHVIFMLATTDPHKMLRTNRSRCVEFELLGPTPAELTENLQRVAAEAQLPLRNDTAAEIVAASESDLGVRGTVMLLEKLAPLIADHELSPDEAAEFLGRPPRSAVLELFSALSSNDLSTVFNTFETLRKRFPVKDLLLRCAEVSRDELLAACNPFQPAAFALATRRLDTFLAAAATPSDLHASAALAQLAGSHDETSKALNLVAHAEGLISSFEARKRDVDALATVLSELEKRTHTALESSKAAPRQRPDLPPRGQQPAVNRPAPPEPRTSLPTTPPPSRTSDLEGLDKVFLAALSKRDSTLAAIVRGCKISVADSAITITHAPQVGLRLRPHQSLLDSVAAALGATVALVPTATRD